jgi:glucose-6-phosphate 1-dehydrogenase
MMADSTTFCIFGVTGDLSHSKLTPALFSLFMKEKLPESFQILGTGRREWSHERLRSSLEEGVREILGDEFERGPWAQFAERIFYQKFDLKEESAYSDFTSALAKVEPSDTNRLYYLATPPWLFEDIVNALDDAGCLQETRGWQRVVVEKPFGYDLESARSLNRSMREHLSEAQIYRIDHYLGKETVQNLLVFRFANAMFEPIWNRNYIDHVQITVAEKEGVGGRAGYYDGVGILRDMFQNHLLQLLSLIAMEPPASFDAQAIRDERAKVLAAVRASDQFDLARDTVRGQYEGYKDESEQIAEGSSTSTYAALKLAIDNWRWQGVPFYLRSGKGLARKSTEIIIQFKDPPHLMFPLPEDYRYRSNLLSICIQPDEGFHLRFEAKVPDTVAEMRSVEMDFHYADSFGEVTIPDAYERLLLDALGGDMSLFIRSDQIEISWRIMDPIIQGWEQGAGPPLERYAMGSWGPREADYLLARAGRKWRLICEHCE